LCVAFLNITPLKTPLSPGHTLVVPREEVGDWLDLEPTLAALWAARGGGGGGRP